MGKVTNPYVGDTARKLTDLGLRDSSARLLPLNSVILSSRAPIGYVVINTVPMAINQGCKGLVPNTQLKTEYLHYYLISVVDLLNALGTGATFKELSVEKLKQVSIPVPPLPEQQRIVSILDQALEAIATAKASAEKNFQNARALLGSHLQAVFARRGHGWIEKPLEALCDIKHGFAFKSKFFNTDGKYIILTPGNFYESGGYRDRGEKQKYYSGEIPLGYVLSEGDLLIAMTEQAAGLLGSPILVPESDKFLHNQRLGLVLKKPGVPWMNEFFFHVFNTEHVRKEIHTSASGVKVRHTSPTKVGEVVVTFPTSVSEQRAIVANLNDLAEQIQRLESTYQRKLAALDELKKSLLHRAFTGELTASEPTVVPVSAGAGKRMQKGSEGLTTTDLHAGILALAYRAHERAGTLLYFGHVKAEKIAHMVEAHLGIDLGRTPVKDAAGPNDYPHLMKVEHRARKAGYFDFRRDGSRYVVSPLRGLNRLIERTQDDLEEQYEEVVRLIGRMAKWDTEQAEIVATTYAAWNNLLLDGLPAAEEDIVRAAREDWHPDKLTIERGRFFKAIEWMREKEVIPRGTGLRVADKPVRAKPTTKQE